MKRLKMGIVLLIFLYLLCFLCSCGGSDVERMVIAWDEAVLNLYRYTGREFECGGLRSYILVMTPERTLFPSDEALREYQDYDTVCRCVEAVYRDLSGCFDGGETEVRIIIAVCGAGGKPLFIFDAASANNASTIT